MATNPYFNTQYLGDDAQRQGVLNFLNAQNWLQRNPQIWDPYGGQLTAGQTAAQSQAMGGVRGLMGFNPQNVTASLADPAQAAFAGNVTARNVTPSRAAYAGDVRAEPGQFAGNVTAGTVSPTTSFGQVQGGSFLSGPGIGAYMNPFTSNVVDSALSDIERSRQLANQQGARSAGASTYGGSRNALVEAETNRGFTEQAARTAAQLRSQGFDTAAGLMGADLSRGLQAGLANQQAAISGAGLGLQGQLANQGTGLQAALANQAARARFGEFGAGLGMQAQLANQAARNQLGQFNAELGLRGSLANQQAALQAGLANQSTLQGLNQFNAGQLNQMGQFNSQLGLQAQLANQQAGLAGAGLNLDAARSLYGFGTQQQAAQQAGLDRQYQEYLRSTYGPMQGYQFLGGLLPGQQIQPPGADLSVGQGIIGGATAGAAFGPPGAFIGGALGGLAGWAF